MKKLTDDMAAWRLRRENMEKPCPYVFPQMFPYFRCCQAFSRAVLLMQRGCMLLFVLACAAAMVPLARKEPVPALIEGISLAALAFHFLFTLLRFLPKRFWRCPCCGLPFPYYAPSRYSDSLKEEECLDTMQDLRIKYVKPKFCPLVLPSACPACGMKFFSAA